MCLRWRNTREGTYLRLYQRRQSADLAASMRNRITRRDDLRVVRIASELTGCRHHGAVALPILGGGHVML